MKLPFSKLLIAKSETECVSLVQGLLLAVRLWGRMPAERAAQCALLPAGAPPPPADFFTRTTRDGERDASEAAAAFFSPGHLQARPLCAAQPVLCEHNYTTVSNGAYI